MHRLHASADVGEAPATGWLDHDLVEHDRRDVVGQKAQAPLVVGQRTLGGFDTVCLGTHRSAGACGNGKRGNRVAFARYSHDADE